MVSAPTCMCDVACSWARKDASTAVRRSRCCCGMAEAYRRLPGGSAPRLVPLRALDHDADGARGARCSGRVGGDDTQPQERGAAVAHAGTAGAIDLDAQRSHGRAGQRRGDAAEAGGAEVDADELRFWEVFGNVRWGVICIVQASAHLS